MIHFIPRRLAAAVVALAFALSVGEGVLAAVCASDGMEECAEGEMLSGEMAMGLPTGEPSSIGGQATANPPSQGPACCDPADSAAEPASGSDDRAPCPFTPMGATGSCQGAAFLAPAYLQLPPATDAPSVLAAPVPTRELLLALAPFEPPRP